MNRKLILSVLLVCTTLLTACGGGQNSAAGSTGTTPVAKSAPLTPQKGGSITVAYKDDLATLDPAIGYDWTNWPAEKLVFDGLLDYDISASGRTTAAGTCTSPGRPGWERPRSFIS